MIIETLIILFVIAIRKKSFENFMSLPTKHYGLLIAFALVKIAIFVCVKIGLPFEILRPISLLSHIFLFLFLYSNRNYKGVQLILAGSLMNFLVMVLNGFKMPVNGELFKKIAGIYRYEMTLNGFSLHHMIIDESTKLWELGDIIPFLKPYPFPKLVSIGDIVLAVGVVLLGYSVLRGDYVDEKEI